MKKSELNGLKNELESYSGTYYLNKLAAILNYSVSSSALLLLSFLWGILLMVASIAAIIFIPFLFYVLLFEKKYFWLTILILLIIVPAILSLLFLQKYILYSMMVLLGIFYIFCFTLRLSVNEWIREKNAARDFRKVNKIDKENLFL